MNICSFLGSAKAPCSILPHLQNAVETLIEKEGVHLFLFQRQGEFDLAVQVVMQLAKCRHPDIEYYAVSGKATGEEMTLRVIPAQDRPDAITHWLLRQAHYVITFAPENDTVINAYKEQAADSGKTVIELCDRLRANG